MTIMGKMNRLGNAPLACPVGTVLFDGNNGQTGTPKLKKGILGFRGQGGGGGGGQCGYYGTGGGGGSGSGFEGEIYISQEVPVDISTGIGGGNRANGTDTVVSGIMTLGGGKAGGSDNGAAGAGGIISILPNVTVITAKVQSNGNPGNKTTGSAGTKGGSDSVLTNTGAGIANANLAGRNASAPGAGGAGGKQWDSAGGAGGYGELKIVYKRAR